jgi:acetate kinase
MAVTKETTKSLHKDIRQEYEKLNNIREFGVKKYSEKYILAKVAEKFYKSPKTIENIVYHRV